MKKIHNGDGENAEKRQTQSFLRQIEKNSLRKVDYICHLSLFPLTPEKVSFRSEKVTFSREKMTFTILKVTFSDEKVTFTNENRKETWKKVTDSDSC